MIRPENIIGTRIVGAASQPGTLRVLWEHNESCAKEVNDCGIHPSVHKPEGVGWTDETVEAANNGLETTVVNLNGFNLYKSNAQRFAQLRLCTESEQLHARHQPASE